MTAGSIHRWDSAGCSPDVAPTGDTIFALSSGRPPAAVAVIRTSGPRAFAAAEALCGALPSARVASLRTLRDPSTHEEIDRALVLRFDAPASATGEDIVEYQCHGGRAVVDRLARALAAMDGMRAAEPGEFTRRALASGRIDLTEAEGLADLIEAETESQRKTALAMAEGALRRQIEAWRERLLDLSARAEAAIDYVGDEDETATDLGPLVDGAAAVAGEIEAALALPRVEPLKEGVRVVVAGPPNAGKSSLLNALCDQERAIVTDIAGTTRDVIEVPVAICGIPFVLVDTAGLRVSDDPVESIGIARAEAEAARADILLWLGERDDAPAHPALLPVHSKADLRPSSRPGEIAVSAVTGSGLRELVDEIVEKAGEILPAEGALALNRRQLALLREALEALRATDVDLVIMAAQLRLALNAFDRLSGRSGVEDMLDRLFGRFCLGK
jgi:tRNA modification GTPase